MSEEVHHPLFPCLFGSKDKHKSTFYRLPRVSQQLEATILLEVESQIDLTWFNKDASYDPAENLGRKETGRGKRTGRRVLQAQQYPIL